MAIIELKPDNGQTGTWWLIWIEQGEVIGRIVQDPSGRCRIAPQGAHWSPMKSFAGRSFETRDAALVDVQLYFQGR